MLLQIQRLSNLKPAGSVFNKNRGSYTSAHVYLNLLNELKKSDKCEACQTIHHVFAPS